MTAEPTIDYESLAQDALRGVVRTVLVRAAKSGLPGDHHFYISFDTTVSGVSLSKRLKEKYPREMTIVLQHRFWDLVVTDDRFEVKLTFDGIPERLVVPFAALKVFFDPSVRYGLQFEDIELGPDSSALVSNGGERDDGRQITSARVAGQRKPKPRKTRAAEPAGASRSVDIDSAPQPQASKSEREGASPAQSDDPIAKPANGGGAQIVSLDKFRKK